MFERRDAAGLWDRREHRSRACCLGNVVSLGYGIEEEPTERWMFEGLDVPR